MPDTPRTVAELKTLFADNSSGDISAQDLRDFVESIANPVSDGFPKGTSRFAVYDTADFGSISAGTTFFPTWEVESDAEGWLNPDPYDSTAWFGSEYLAEQTIVLPSGLYSLELQVNMNTDALADAGIAAIDVIDVRLAGATDGYYFHMPGSQTNTCPPFNAGFLGVQVSRTVVAASDFDGLVISTEAQCRGANITGGNAYLGVYRLGDWTEPSTP